MKWKSPEEWTELKAGRGCSICQDLTSDENQHSFKVAELKQSIVRLPKNQSLRGWTTVVLKRHANELFELTPRERSEFWDEVSMVSKALFDMYNPAKINYCIWGNHCPHIHCHLFVQTFEDDPSKPVDQNEREAFLSETDYQRMINELRNLIK